jgi:glutathione peroxidase
MRAAVVALALIFGRLANAANDSGCAPLLQHKLPTLKGSTQDLCAYRGKVLLIVNTASFCGFTGQYQGLEALYRKYRDRGLVVLGFPSNDFGHQEPGSSKDIAAFCERAFQVQFPMFEKSSVTGSGANPVFRELTAASREAPQWNFHKYLVDRAGTMVVSFPSQVAPESVALTSRIESMLSATVR